MKPAGMADTPEVAEVISMADRLSATERLFIARWLLDSILHVDTDDDVAWRQLSLSAFEQDWDNDDDAIYDDLEKALWRSGGVTLSCFPFRTRT